MVEAQFQFEDDVRFERWDEFQVKTSIETLGSLDWSFYHIPPQRRTQEVEKFPDLRESVRRQTNVNADSRESVAIIDWTSLDNTCRLLGGERILDPFITILDLTAVVAAVIFYDRVIVLDDMGRANAGNELLNLDDVIRAVDPGRTEQFTLMGLLLDAHFVSALTELDRATTSQRPWLKCLEGAWAELLPNLEFPKHHRNAFEENFGYNSSPDRHSGLRVIFDLVDEQFFYSDREAAKHMILDNDIRALFYERLANAFSSIIHEDRGYPPVHYVGGCLRVPMLLARAKLAESILDPHVTLENWLQKQWARLYRTCEYAVRLPFWMDAVLHGVRSPTELGNAVCKTRDAARALRARRSQIETALALGDALENDKLLDALGGDGRQFSDAVSAVGGVAVESATVAAKSCLPPGLTQTLGAAANHSGKLGQEWLEEMALRFFRPHLWCIYSMGRKARRLQRSVERLFELFHLQRGDATRPKQFLEKFGAISHIT
ncbi:hypothetical protein ACFL5Q_02985 [Planctomycetota bacterium]